MSLSELKITYLPKDIHTGTWPGPARSDELRSILLPPRIASDSVDPSYGSEDSRALATWVFTIIRVDLVVIMHSLPAFCFTSVFVAQFFAACLRASSKVKRPSLPYLHGCAGMGFSSHHICVERGPTQGSSNISAAPFHLCYL